MRSFVLSLAAGLAVVSTAAALMTAPVPATEGTSTDAPIAWELLDCDFVVAFVPVEVAKLEPLVPDGFIVRAVPERWIGAGRLVELVGVESEVCRGGTVGSETDLQGTAYASVWVGVTPPADLQVPGFDGGYYVNFDPLIPHDGLRQAFHDAGVPAHAGSVAVTPGSPGVDGLTVEADYTLDGLGEFAVAAVGPSDPTGIASGAFYQWTQASDGDLARWYVEWTMHTFHQGPGTLTVPAGSWLEHLFGETTVAAPLVYHGNWDYTNGAIELPS